MFSPVYQPGERGLFLIAIIHCIEYCLMSGRFVNRLELLTNVKLKAQELKPL